MEPSSKHSAPGQMAGYLFQPERALFWLSKSHFGDKIGIETDDDVVVKSRSSVLREQDKHSVRNRISPLGNKSTDLWKTLSIWVLEIATNKLDLEKTGFVIVTNKTLSAGLAKQISLSKKDSEVKACVKNILEIAEKPSLSIKFYADIVKQHRIHLAQLVSKLDIYDGESGSYGEKLKQQTLAQLRSPESAPGDQIYFGLMGWVHEMAMTSWRKGNPCWIKSRDFFNQFYRLVNICHKQTFTEMAKSLLPVSEEDRQAQKVKRFVIQLKLLSIKDTDPMLLDAIDDFLRAASERTRLAQEGNVTQSDIEAFDDRLRDRWALIFDRNNRILNSRNDEEIGFETLTQTLDHREPLAGQGTEEWYLTRGSYQFLADKLIVGWHPDFDNLLKEPL